MRQSIYTVIVLMVLGIPFANAQTQIIFRSALYDGRVNGSSSCFPFYPDTTGMQMEAIQDNFRLYPNPADDVVDAEFSCSKDNRVTVQLYNMDGRLLSTERRDVMGGNTARIPVDMSYLPQGLYIYRVMTSQAACTGLLVHKWRL